MFDEHSASGFPLSRTLGHSATGLPDLGASTERLSIDEIGTRIAQLHAEIERLEAARDSKESTRRAADSFFRI